jgi:hypothetical protein
MLSKGSQTQKSQYPKSEMLQTLKTLDHQYDATSGKAYTLNVRVR